VINRQTAAERGVLSFAALTESLWMPATPPPRLSVDKPVTDTVAGRRDVELDGAWGVGRRPFLHCVSKNDPPVTCCITLSYTIRLR